MPLVTCARCLRPVESCATQPNDQAVRDALTALCPDPISLEQRAANDPRVPSGTHVFAAAKCSSWYTYTYTLTNADKQTATVLILTCTAVIGKGSADGRGAKPWSMPVGGLVPPAPLGFIKPTVGALELRPATANLMRPVSKPPLVTPRYDSCSSPSP